MSLVPVAFPLSPGSRGFRYLACHYPAVRLPVAVLGSVPALLSSLAQQALAIRSDVSSEPNDMSELDNDSLSFNSLVCGEK
ncbi:Hypothetical predicted protein [Pelobates cultripes]|uniref:Uncharacterized protein n=1 Tax=Pelobates cultripes TaxID=61616 RepID=A0AAD1T0S6_PELCU|nr:Hypothetical predicted protein [Pelobates cultripes]